MKALSTYRKYLRWLLWPGLALTTAGLVTGFVDAWSVLAIVLLAIGVVFTLISLVLGGFGYRSFWQSRSTQAGTNAVVATLSVLLILGVVNFLAVQYAPRIDLTEGGLFTLAPESQSVVKNLQQPIQVVLFDASLNPNDKQLLESYRKFNDNLTYEHINPFQDPATAREFNVSGEGREVHLVAGEDMLFVQALGAQGLTEQDLTNKLAQIGRDRNAVVYFLQGHEEFVIDGSTSGYAQAAAALEADGFTIEPLSLDQTAAVPEDADAVVIAGPKQAFFAPEVEALKTYLNEGGSILLLVDPQTEPELDTLLTDWGVTLDERLIVDASNTGQIVGLGPAAPLVTAYGAHPITDDFNNGRSFYPLARPVVIEPVEGVEATPLLLSNAQSFAESLSETGELNVDTEKSPEGPFNIGVVLTKEIEDSPQETAEDETTAPEESESDEESPDVETSPADESAEDEEPSEDSDNLDSEASQSDEDDGETADEEESGDSDALDADESVKEARLVVVGNATFATDGLFDQQLNGDVFLNSVTWLSNLDDSTLSIRPKEITNRRITMTVSRQILISVLALLVFPLVGVIGAGIAWFRRR
ncbi:Gldg family protein [Leptolyngbya cf. ectocarpi LEGE 11479]|uniref:Gldg family protein n=1 Tax=Leptolyngbya cf. ectocarpi LEGE 11479 TaxID=1828722 RepID=A0A928WYD6_LEPEC|nr:Gldg family protein [Leptolyngbya ectocarpi]MBE9065117.1 Gldg family protein [Leptolyngbya cf. ectocarpi LEGE 11479]